MHQSVLIQLANADSFSLLFFYIDHRDGLKRHRTNCCVPRPLGSSRTGFTGFFPDIKQKSCYPTSPGDPS